MGKARVMRIYAEGVNEEFMLALTGYFAEKNIRVVSLVRRSENKWYKKDTCVMVELDLGKRQRHDWILADIRKLEGLRYVEEIEK